MDVIFDEFEKYKDSINDEKFLLDIGFDAIVLKLQPSTVKRQYKNLKILLNNKV